MKKKLLTIHQYELPALSEYPVAACTVTGLRSAKFVHPDDYALWLCVADLQPGAEMVIGTEHGDYGIYVEEGDLEVGGQLCPAGGSVIVESGVPARITSPSGARIYHNGPADPEPPTGGLLGSPKSDGHCVHVVGPEGWFQSGDKEKVKAVWFADSTCPTCRISQFTVARQPSHARVGRPHSHSTDELIHIITGAIRLGAREYGAGTSLVIPAEVHYAVTSEFGLKFLNYRRDSSEQTFYDGERETEPESGLGRAGVEVKDLVNVPG